MQENKNCELDPENPEYAEEVDRNDEVSETSRSDKDELIVVELPKTGKRNSPSVPNLVDALQSHCDIAKFLVTDCTLFTNLFINPTDVNILVHHVWGHAERKQKLYKERLKEANTLVIHCFFDQSRPITDGL